jgi:archaellum component FlaG (FlaF/FlaG flagellin family)
MPNGGTAKVDGTVVTSAPAGAEVTISAPEAEPGTEFNGWTSTSEGVTFEDASKATTKFTMPANDVTISASFQNIAYNITMINGGTAYVDGEPATTAEAGTVVTIKAKSSVSTPAKFNGWTTTTEGVEFRDADSPETTFVMPISDVTITASFEGVTPYVPSYSTGTSTTTSSGTASSVDSASSKAKMWAVQNDDKSSITVGWEKVNGATKYSLYVKKNGKLEKVVDTKKTKVLIKNPANNVNLEYVLKYTIGGVESGENSAYTASIKVYYKPAVKASSKDGAVILKWNKVEGAEKYRVYKYTGGKLVKVADTTANAVRISKVTAGKTYKYAVKAYVDGKWTKVTKSDIVSVKVK